ncbi:hypothetical protein COOONC_13150 [Cooperia oncophora]
MFSLSYNSLQYRSSGIMEDIAVTKFREYLRVNTEQPNPDYAACQNFLFNLADELGIERRATVPGKPFIIMTIPGTQPELKSLMLYSHTDVVPTFKVSCLSLLHCENGI